MAGRFFFWLQFRLAKKREKKQTQNNNNKTAPQLTGSGNETYGATPRMAHRFDRLLSVRPTWWRGLFEHRLSTRSRRTPKPNQQPRRDDDDGTFFVKQPPRSEEAHPNLRICICGNNQQTIYNTALLRFDSKHCHRTTRGPCNTGLHVCMLPIYFRFWETSLRASHNFYNINFIMVFTTFDIT